jgi:hypothetical protein
MRSDADDPAGSATPLREDDVPDVELYFDPVCPFCWQTSKWLRQVQRLTGLDIGYRFISLLFVNEARGYGDQPASYRELHTQGTRLLRVAAATRAAHGEPAVGAFYRHLGEALFEVDAPEPGGFDGMVAHQLAGPDLPAVLRAAGLPERLAEAATSEAYDAVIRQETAAALARAGKDVGTPVLSFAPPDGPAFFGPVISDLPSDEEAVDLYEALARLARWPGFAELKRSLRTFPDVQIGRALRPDAEAPGAETLGADARAVEAPAA